MDPLKTINIPNTETMCSFSLHFQTSVAPYEQHLSALEENQEPVAANWQGDASVAYEKTNQQLVSIGRMHIAQMQQASHIFDHTANLFDEGKGLQDMAQWQWGMGMAAETALAFPVASSWYVLAQKTQEGALAMVESARAYFNSGFAALHEQISSALSLKPGGLGWSTPPAYAVDPVSLSQNTSPVSSEVLGAGPDRKVSPSSVPTPTGERSVDTFAKELPSSVAVPIGERSVDLSTADGSAVQARGEPPTASALLQLLFASPPVEDLPAYSKTPQEGEVVMAAGPALPWDDEKVGEKSKSGHFDASTLGEEGVAHYLDPRTLTHVPPTTITVGMGLIPGNTSAPVFQQTSPIATTLNALINQPIRLPATPPPPVSHDEETQEDGEFLSEEEEHEAKWEDGAPQELYRERAEMQAQIQASYQPSTQPVAASNPMSLSNILQADPMAMTLLPTSQRTDPVQTTMDSFPLARPGKKRSAEGANEPASKKQRRQKFMSTASAANLPQPNPVATSSSTLSQQPGPLAAAMAGIIRSDRFASVLNGYGIYAPKKREVKAEINDKKKYGDQDVADYINSFDNDNNKQFYLVKHGLIKERRREVWSLLSPKARESSRKYDKNAPKQVIVSPSTPLARPGKKRSAEGANKSASKKQHRQAS